MDVSFTKLLSLLFVYFMYGPPDYRVDDFSFGFSFSFGGGSEPALYVQFKYDPVFVYNRELPNNLCGMTIYNAVFISPRAGELGCEKTLEHEMAHVWQWRTYGLLLPIVYGAFNESFEPPFPRSKYEIPYHKKVMNFSLITISIPIFPY
jgi:hypothetical protein